MGNYYPQQPPSQYPQHQQQPPAPQKSGFPVWIIVLIVVVAGGAVIVPVLAVMSIYGVRKYIANAKTVEARNSLGEIAREAAVAYEEDQIDPLHPAVPFHRLCPSGSGPVPTSMTMLRGAKYQSAPSDWNADRATNSGFFCLKFEMMSPQYYSYEYTAAGKSSPGDGFIAVAHGDLNGDGVASTFKIQGKIDASNNLVVAPTIAETSPEE